ncbi:MAG: hypothetical protein LQ346_004513, partial [Caloplaca aetnensis]
MDPNHSVEKAPRMIIRSTTANVEASNTEVPQDGYILDATQLAPDVSVKLAHDGQTVLIPQPSDDPDDPLNWSQTKKHILLAVVCACTFLPDYGSVTGAITLIPQAAEYGITPDEVNHSQSGNQFMVGAGGVVAVMFSAYFGRLPVLFWFMVVATATAAGQAGSHGFNGFFVPRVLNGFFAGAAQGINIWQASVILSPYLGPLLASFMLTRLSWRWPFWIYTIETGLCLLAVIIWGDETYYDRRLPEEKQPLRESHLLRLLGVEQWCSRHLRNGFLEAMMRPLRTISRPVVLLANFYYMCTFAWVVGINATLALFLTSLYGFGPKQTGMPSPTLLSKHKLTTNYPGLFFLAPILATILAEAAGHHLHDFLARLSIRRHRGRLEPEARLTVIYTALPFLLAGLVLLGFALDRGWHYMLAALAWGLYVFGTMVVSVG